MIQQGQIIQVTNLLNKLMPVGKVIRGLTVTCLGIPAVPANGVLNTG